MVHREGTRVVPYLGPDGFDLLFATEELVQDMQALSMLSMLKFRRFAWYLFGATDVSPSFAYKDKPNTVWVWADADWRGNARTCKSTSAVAVQLENYGIEAWSVLQQVVLLSSAESEFYAVDAPNVDRRETPDHRWNQIRRSGAYPETCAEDVDEQTIQAVEKGARYDCQYQQRGQVYEKDQGETPWGSQSARTVDTEGRDCGG